MKVVFTSIILNNCAIKVKCHLPTILKPSVTTLMHTS